MRNLRKEKGLSQERLAERMQRSTAFVGHIERGTRKMSLETLWELTHVLGCSADELLGFPMAEENIRANARVLLEIALEMARREQWD